MVDLSIGKEDPRDRTQLFRDLLLEEDTHRSPSESRGYHVYLHEITHSHLTTLRMWEEHHAPGKTDPNIQWGGFPFQNTSHLS